MLGKEVFACRHCVDFRVAPADYRTTTLSEALMKRAEASGLSTHINGAE